MVRLSTTRIVRAVFLPHRLGDDLEELKPQVKVPEITHLFTLAQHSCGLSVIITHPRVIKSTLRSTFERV